MANDFPNENLVIVYDNSEKAITNSVLVAKKFGKEHKHVLEAIRNTIKGCADFSATPMFEETTYINEQNGQTYPMFIMNRDGFSLLTMGFTGKKAMKFKLDFIEAFNKMEAIIKQRTLPQQTAPQFAVPQSFSEALMFAAQQQKKIEQQQALLVQKENFISEQSAKIEQKEEIIELQSNELMKSAPKVNYYDQTLQSKDTMTISEIGNVYGLSGVMLNRRLVEAGIIYKRDPSSKLYLLKKPYSEWKLAAERTQTYTRTDGSIGTKHLMVYNERGRRFICALIENDFDLKQAIAAIQGKNNGNDGVQRTAV